MSARGRTSRAGRGKRGPGGAPPRLDATNLAGITSLMNRQQLRGGVDLEKAEGRVMGKAAPRRAAEAADPVKIYTRELNDLAGQLGIDFLDDGAEAGAASGGEGPAEPRGRPRNPLRGSAIDDLLGDLDLDSGASEAEGEEASETEGSSSDGGGSYRSGSGSSGGGSYRSGSGSSESGSYRSGSGSSGGGSYRSGSGSSDGGSSDGGGSDGSVLSGVRRGLGIDARGVRRRSRRRGRVAPPPRRPKGGRRPPRLARLTEEQERRHHINSVLGDMRQETRTSFGVEHERTQDVKASKIEQISQLRMTLEEEGIDCSGVGAPTMASPLEEIDSVLSILKLKNDRNRYSTLAEEVILGVAEAVETVLDGSRELPVLGWKPDYTGYHNTVNVKLHRMRFETSRVVGSVIEKYNVGPTARIVMELLPSFFLYPRQQRKQRGDPGLHSEIGPRVADARGAYSAIRRSEAPDALDLVANI